MGLLTDTYQEKQNANFKLTGSDQVPQISKLAINPEKKDWLAISYFNFIENTNKQLNLEEERQRLTIEKLIEMKKQLINGQNEDFENPYDGSQSEKNGSREFVDPKSYETREKLKFELRESVEMNSVEELGASRNLSSMLKAIRNERGGELIDIHEYKKDIQGYSSTTDQDNSRQFFSNKRTKRVEQESPH